MSIFRSKYLVGLETEYFVLDNDGNIVNKADLLLEKMGKRAKKECAKTMIEVISRPTEAISGAAKDLLDKMTTLVELAEKNDMRIYNCGTYPGSFDPIMNEDAGYKIKEKIFGISRWKIAGRCVGFHCHYTLTSGTFDRIAKNIKLLLNVEKNQAFVDNYNMLIALDVAFLTFLQSSPFYQGKHYGKDSRAILYRGNDFFKVDGLYTELQDFGALPEYKHIITDIMYQGESRFQKWHELMKESGVNLDPNDVYNSPYDVNWGPVKVNPIGTFELRGMDMSRFHLIVSSAELMKHVLEAINKGVIHPTVNEIGIKEPFKVEGKKLYIPPFEHLQKVLQKESALKGLESKDVRNYCSSFLKFMPTILKKESRRFLKPFKDMTDSKTTVSDEIMKHAKRMGVKNTIRNEEAARLSLKITDGIKKEIRNAERLVGK